MTKCPNCGFENNDKDTCIICGQSLKDIPNNINEQNIQENNQPNPNKQNKPQQPIKSQYQQEYNNQEYQNQNNQQNNQYSTQNNQQNNHYDNGNSNYYQQYNRMDNNNQNNYQRFGQQNQYNEYSNPEYQNYGNTQGNQNYGNQNYGNQNGQYLSHKSKTVAFILGFFIAGVGYAYIDQWGKGIAVFLIVYVCVALSILIIPPFIALIIWIYSLYDVNRQIGIMNNRTTNNFNN